MCLPTWRRNYKRSHTLPPPMEERKRRRRLCYVLNEKSKQSCFSPRVCVCACTAHSFLSFDLNYNCWSCFSAPALYPTEVHVYSIEGIGARVNFRGISTLVGEEPLMGYKVSLAFVVHVYFNACVLQCMCTSVHVYLS